MKALVISGSSELFDYVSPLLKERGFDLIHYRWIVKALDNIEEIQPDVIVLSAIEYPRHWKTLAGFLQSGICTNDVKIYLCETTNLSVEDAAKADQLGVKSFQKEFKEKQSVSVEIAFNELNGNIHFAIGKYYKDEELVELQFNSDGKLQLTNGSYLNYVSLFDGNDVSSCSAQVKEIVGNKVSLIVKEL